jgi:hypothetical protein
LAGCALQRPPATHVAVRPSASPSAAVPAASTPASDVPLRKPASASLTLKGTVALDPSYIVATGAGSIIANNGSSVLAVGATQAKGGQIVSNNGGGVIANNGGNIIANHGAGLRALMAAGPAGALVPAAGMEVGVRSLRTGKALAVGVDGQGQPVYRVYSNLTGGFELYIPAEEAGNVLIETTVPQSTDPRQAYAVLAPTAAAAGQAVDDDAAVVTRFVRDVAVRRFVDYLEQPPDVSETYYAGIIPDELVGPLRATLGQLRSAAAAAGISADAKLQPAVWALVAGMTDKQLARLDLGSLVLDHAQVAYWGTCTGEEREGAIAGLTALMRQVREGAAARLAADPAAFDQEAYLQLGNACKPGTYVIKRPADLVGFLVDEYLAPNRYDTDNWRLVVLNSVDAAYDAKGIDNAKRLYAATAAVAIGVLLPVLTNTDGALDEALARIAAFKPDASIPAGAPTPGLPTCPLPSISPPQTPAPGTHGRPLAVPQCGGASPNAAQVALATQTYRDVLGRDPDPEGGANYAKALANGGSQVAMRRKMANSDEARRALAQLYQQVLGRSATAEELAGWVEKLAVDTSLAQVRQALAGAG